MKASVYNLQIPEFPSPEETLIYNTRTQAIGVFDNSLSNFLGRPGETLTLDEAEFSQLLQEGFCVPDSADEKYMLEQWFKELCYDRRCLTITLLTTFQCNFDCVYCFEKENNPPLMNMSHYTAQTLCSWVRREVKKHGIKSVKIFFYGGEPLMNKDCIYEISKNMKDFSEELKIEFKFGIVTNGFLIRKEDTEAFLKLGLDFFRITLDGTAEWHDKTRPLKGGKPTFNVILENMLNHTDGVRIFVSGNITDANFLGIVELIEYLGRHPLKARIHSMTFGNVMDNHFRCKSNQTCYEPPEEKFFENYRIIRDIMKKNQFMDSKSRIGMQRCPFKLEKSFITITPDGAIYKCPVTVGRKEFCVGSVYGENLNIFNQKILEKDLWKNCFPCPYLPLCQGGCYYEAYLKNGDLFSTACPKKVFDTLLPESLKEEYEKLL